MLNTVSENIANTNTASVAAGVMVRRAVIDAYSTKGGVPLNEVLTAVKVANVILKAVDPQADSLVASGSADVSATLKMDWSGEVEVDADQIEEAIQEAITDDLVDSVEDLDLDLYGTSVTVEVSVPLTAQYNGEVEIEEIEDPSDLDDAVAEAVLSELSDAWEVDQVSVTNFQPTIK
jgi:hypothetical protein